MHQYLYECDEILPADTDIVFAVNVWREKPELLGKCFSMLRAAYPNSPVLAILDGIDGNADGIPEILGEAREYGVFVLPGDRLKKGVHHGAAIWTRLFDHAMRFNTDYVVKMDPDTRVHRRLTYMPRNTNCVAGRIMSANDPARHVQGGFQLMPIAFVELALAESMRDEYKDPKFWKSGQSEVFTSRDLVSTDYLLSAMMRNLSSIFVPHPEIECRSLRGAEPFSKAAAVTHPHKDPKE